MGEGFQDTDLGETEEQTLHQNVVGCSLMELSASESVPNNEEEDIVEAVRENKFDII